MSELTAKPRPTDIHVHQKSRIVEIFFDDGLHARLPFEFLRVYSPSAAVRGHGPGQEVLQVGKENVDITSIEPVGHYAIKPHFDDGHSSGIYSWDILHRYGLNYQEMWDDYLHCLAAAGHVRQERSDDTV